MRPLSLQSYGSESNGPPQPIGTETCPPIPPSFQETAFAEIDEKINPTLRSRAHVRWILRARRTRKSHFFSHEIPPAFGLPGSPREPGRIVTFCARIGSPNLRISFALQRLVYPDYLIICLYDRRILFMSVYLITAYTACLFMRIPRTLCIC